MKTVYLAGPDVFFAQANEHFDRLEALCHRYGLKGLRPSDGGLSAGLTGSGDMVSQRIYDANMACIQSCDAVLANLMPFRGQLEPDSGTVFEVGVAVALGKQVAGYFPQCSEHYESRVVRTCGVLPAEGNGPPFDATYLFMIEQFQQPLNLMLARSTSLFCTVEEALSHLSTTLGKP